MPAQTSSASTRLTGASATVLATLLAGYVLTAMRIDLPILTKHDPVQFITIDAPASAEKVQVAAASLPHIDAPEPPMFDMDLPVFEAPRPAPAAPAPSPEPGPVLAAEAATTGLPVPNPGTHRTAFVLPVHLPAATPVAQFPALLRGKSGVTKMRLCVTTRGLVREVEVATSSGVREFDKRAVQWMQQQRFQPGTVDGVITRMCGSFLFDWRSEQAGLSRGSDLAPARE